MYTYSKINLMKKFTFLFSIKVLKRCVPQNVYDVAKNIISNTYGAINSWDAVEHVLSDLYATWPHILVFSLLAFGMLISKHN